MLPQEDPSAIEKQHQEEVWNDLVSELWETKLQYLRGGQPYTYNTKAATASELHIHRSATLSETKTSSEIVKHLIQDESVQKNLLDSYKAADPSRGLESSAELACMYQCTLIVHL